ncbi:MAG: restriction endonuclease subunit S [Gammaproteobacteria bacterium]|nr:restriction endonuclease subunit S [Gammaproteobacteria bacterium]
MEIAHYDNFADSDVEWIGQVPAHWQVLKGKYIGRIATTPSLSDEELTNEETTLCYIRVSELNFVENTPYFTQGSLYAVDDEVTHTKNSIIFPKRGEAIFTNKASILKFGALLDPNLMSWEIEQDKDLKYFYYTLLARRLDDIADTSTVPQINNKHIMPTFFPCPALEEQQKIAAFLDYKTQQIDQLIEKKKALIEKLEEKRIAVITQAVTKGLDKNAKLKPSGVDWLGDVPEHWDVQPVKFMTQIMRGKFSHRPRNDPAFYNGEYPFIQTGDVSQAGKYVESYTQTLNEKGYAVSKEFPSGTLVMTIAANIGDMAIINFNACFPDSIVGFVPENNVQLNYLFYMFLAMKKKLMSTAVLNTQLNLNIDRIASLFSVCPPEEEQFLIYEFLDPEMQRIDRIKSKMEEAVNSLVDYRVALITSAVTGKIDVRKIKIPKEAA